MSEQLQQLDRYSPNRFVGRRRERQAFAEALDASLANGDGRKTQLFLLYGEGGMGKTTLLKQFYAKFRDFPLRDQFEVVHIDFEEYKGQIRSSLDIMDILRGKLEQKYGTAFETYTALQKSVRDVLEAVNRLKVRHAQLTDPPDASDSIDIKVGDSPQHVAAGKNIRQVEEKVIVTHGGIYQKVLGRGISEKEELKRIGVDLERNKAEEEAWLRVQLKPEEWLVYQNPQRELSKAFVASINEILKKVTCVFLFDTYELIEKDFDIWMRDGLVAHTMLETNRVLFVLAGRDDISSKYKDKFPEEYLYPVQLSTFSRLDIEEFLDANLKPESVAWEGTREGLIDFVAGVSRGVPLAVESLVNALRQGRDIERYYGDLNQKTLSVREIVAQTTYRFLKYCMDRDTDTADERREKQLHRDYIYTFAILRDYENQTEQERALDVIWKKCDSYTETLSSVGVVKQFLASNYSFMFTFDGNMHPVVKEFTRTVLRDGSSIIPRGNLYLLNDAALHYFQTKLASIDGNIASKVRNRDWCETALSLLNHLFWGEQWEEAIRQLVRWWKWASRYSQSGFREKLLGAATLDQSLTTRIPVEFAEVIQVLVDLARWVSGGPTESTATALLEQKLFDWLDRDSIIIDLLDRATALARKLQLQLALEKLKQGEKLCNPREFTVERAKAYAMIARGYVRVPIKAVGFYQDALKLDNQSIIAHLGLAELFYSRGQLIEAIEEYEKLRDLDSSNPELYNIEERLEGVRKLKEQIEKYDFANIGKSDARLVARFLAYRGNIRAKRGQIGLALEDYRQAARSDAQYHYARIKEGNALRQLGRTAEALQVFSRLAIELKRKPKIMSRSAHSELLASVYDGLGATLLFEGVSSGSVSSLRVARRRYKHAITLAPNYVNALTGIGKVELHIARMTVENFQVGNVPGIPVIIRYFDQALEWKQDAYWIHNYLGIQYGLIDEKSKADAHFSRALDIIRERLLRQENQLLYHLHYALALSLAALHEPTKSRASLEEAIAICNSKGVVNEFRSELTLLRPLVATNDLLPLIETMDSRADT